mmetsp:Transcript_26240/g.47674  ORF Transcript_26240/g.47674 Transcript_26240/m.47674 type:complete len:80 (+) Transcript_26240:448-687(+)
MLLVRSRSHPRSINRNQRAACLFWNRRERVDSHTREEEVEEEEEGVDEDEAEDEAADEEEDQEDTAKEDRPRETITVPS